ncbi:hypothetical protein EDD63_1115 [Breznakia blatticola]|uniref:DUF1307 domain-containing protein n=1 Tax=Breznakia blatticola TaxID=1754012 RepID=A0A4R7ZRJ9_9FIRM|nr:hypothetical protein [Breznakia blatticola]TDW20593.1 hypothetical protein EDD63_1115 [Breznakia blatticola]
MKKIDTVKKIIYLCCCICIMCGCTKSKTMDKVQYTCTQINDDSTTTVVSTYQNNEMINIEQKFKIPYSAYAEDKEEFIYKMTNDIENHTENEGQTFEFMPFDDSFELSVAVDFEKVDNVIPLDTSYISMIISVDTLECEDEFINALKKGGYTCESTNESDK